MDYGQWPGHNPWSLGGAPLLGNPMCSLFSIKGLMVLMFGTSLGLRLSIPLYLSIGFWGAWKLSRIWWHESMIRLIFALFATANPAMAFHYSMGHLHFLNVFFMPLLFYFLLNYREDAWAGFKAAIVYGIIVNDSPAYMPQYGTLILIGIYIHLFIVHHQEGRKALLRWLSLFIPVAAALSFYRLATVLPIALDFPRITDLKIHFGPRELLTMYLCPYAKVSELFPIDKFGPCAFPHEVMAYTGVIAFILFMFDLARGIKWWHIVTVMLIWASAGNDSWVYPMYWIQKIPSFSSHLCFTRIRVFLLLFGSIAAVSGLRSIFANASASRQRYLKGIIVALGIIMIAEPLFISYQIMKFSRVKAPAYMPERDTSKEFQNTGKLRWPEGTPRAIESDLQTHINLSYRAIKMNLGALRDYGDPYFVTSDVSRRIGRDEPGYQGEFHQAGQKVTPLTWTPNRLSFRGLTPTIPLTVNMNPGNPWYNKVTPLFPTYHIVEFKKDFEVMPDDHGEIDLIYRHPGQREGIVGTVIFTLVSVAIILLFRNRPFPARSA